MLASLRIGHNLHCPGSIFSIKNEQIDFNPRLLDCGSDGNICNGLPQLSVRRKDYIQYHTDCVLSDDLLYFQN